jgi:hypothetical protein
LRNLDFGFWILDFGLKWLKADAQPGNRLLNPKSRIQNPKYEWLQYAINPLADFICTHYACRRYI